MIGYILGLWHSLHTSLLHQFAGQAPQAGVTLEKAILTLKILRKLIILGLKKPDECPDAMKFISKLFEEVKTLLEVRKSLPPHLQDNLEKYCVLHQKIWYDLLENHPFSFVQHISTCLSFICSLCFTPQGEGHMFQRFTIFSLNLLKGILLCMEYRPAKNVEDTRDPLTLQAHSIKQEFFRPETIQEICSKLISNYLPLTGDDLQLWDEDAEGFAGEECGDSWKYSWRPCCETVFLTLFHEYREILSPLLVSLVRDNHAPVDPANLTAILHKDAIYNAVGLAAFDLYDEIDFDSWLTSSLSLELSVGESNYRIVRRRVCWLMGQWSGVKLSPELRPRLYEMLMPMLTNNQDLVVRLAAAKAMKVVIDDFEFSVEELEPYLEQVFSLLFSLLKEVGECDTKLNVLNVLSYLIERVGVSIRPICSALLHYLPTLWEESANHNMLRCSILSTLVFIVQGLGTVSEGLLPFLGPVLELSIDLTQVGFISHVIFLEDYQHLIWSFSGQSYLPPRGRAGAVADPAAQHGPAPPHPPAAARQAAAAADHRLGEPPHHHLHPPGLRAPVPAARHGDHRAERGGGAELAVLRPPGRGRADDPAAGGDLAAGGAAQHAADPGAAAADGDGRGARGLGLSHAHVPPPLYPRPPHPRQPGALLQPVSYNSYQTELESQ